MHQSDWQALSRCGLQAMYKLKGLPDQTNSAAVFGTVVHNALHTMELKKHEGADLQTATQAGLESFAYYWNPLHIEALTDQVPADGWLRGQTYGGLRERGIDAIQQYATKILADDTTTLLGFEYGFVVPIDGTFDPETGGPHLLGGSVDRLGLRKYGGKPAVVIDDWKTGKEYTGDLRFNLQFSAYAYATTKREFWVGYGGEDGFGEERGDQLWRLTKDYGRRTTWVNLRKFKMQDAGWRGPIDYARVALVAEQYAAMVAADIFPMTVNGEVCPYCPYRKVCAGTGVPPQDHGDPNTRGA